MIPTRLEPILTSVRQRADERRTRISTGRLLRRAQPDPTRRERFVQALRHDGFALLAECKRRSPSAGKLADEPTTADLVNRASAYAQGGAAALSILTEQDWFGGSLSDLEAIVERPDSLPCLRKDFVLDEGMVLESAEAGASAILLIAACLEDPALGDLRRLARALGLAVLVEVHDERELDRALAVEPDAIGVNARDLRTFEVDLATVERLLPRVPTSFLRVAESGVRTFEDLERVRAAGADAALVGEALMRAPDPAARLTEWMEALRVRS